MHRLIRSNQVCLLNQAAELGWASLLEQGCCLTTTRSKDFLPQIKINDFTLLTFSSERCTEKSHNIFKDREGRGLVFVVQVSSIVSSTEQPGGAGRGPARQSQRNPITWGGAGEGSGTSSSSPQRQPSPGQAAAARGRGAARARGRSAVRQLPKRGQ